MYTEFYTKTLNEYNKILKILDSCETWEQFCTMENISYTFAQNCEWRTTKLYNYFERGFSISRYKNYRSFEKMAKIMCDDLIDQIKTWTELYKNALDEATQLTQKQDEDSKKRKIVGGFNGLFKKTKKCKRKR